MWKLLLEATFIGEGELREDCRKSGVKWQSHSQYRHEGVEVCVVFDHTEKSRVAPIPLATNVGKKSIEEKMTSILLPGTKSAPL